MKNDADRPAVYPEDGDVQPHDAGPGRVNVGGVNINLAALETSLGRRPTEAEMKDIARGFLERVGRMEAAEAVWHPFPLTRPRRRRTARTRSTRTCRAVACAVAGSGPPGEVPPDGPVPVSVVVPVVLGQIERTIRRFLGADRDPPEPAPELTREQLAARDPHVAYLCALVDAGDPRAMLDEEDPEETPRSRRPRRPEGDHGIPGTFPEPLRARQLLLDLDGMGAR